MRLRSGSLLKIVRAVPSAAKGELAGRATFRLRRGWWRRPPGTRNGARVERRAVIKASVVGYAIPAANPPPSRARKRTVSLGENAARRENGTARIVPPTAIVLRPYRSPQGAQPQDRTCQPKRVPNRDQVKRGLAGVEMLPDIWQGDVRHREIQVRDCRDQDQRASIHPARRGAVEGG